MGLWRVHTALLFALLLGRASLCLASSDTWRQAAWTGGASAGVAAYPASSTTWTQYQSKTDTVTVSGGALTLNSLTYSWTTTDNSATSSGFNFAGSTWTAAVSPVPAADLLNAIGPGYGDGSNGDFNTATYVSGISGITKLTNTTFAVDTGVSPNGAYYFGNFTVGAGSTVTASGINPLVIFATGTVSINGVLSSTGTAASGTTGGVGGCNAGAGGAGAPGSSQAGVSGSGIGGGGAGTSAGGGGGGGGHGGAGGVYALGGYGAAGIVYNLSSLLVASGGSGGGGGGVGSVVGVGGGGGGGGGYIFIRGKTVRISATGSVSATGGAASVGVYSGAGGGSGGAIRIDASIFTSTGSIKVDGGAAGNGSGWDGGGGGGGRIRINADNYSNTGTTSFAAGGAGGGSGGGGTAGTFTTGTLASIWSGDATYTSGVFDTTSGYNFYDISWSSSIPAAGGSIVVVVRAGNQTADCPGACTGWTSWTTAATNPYGLGGAGMNGKRYVQWGSTFTVVSSSVPLLLNDLTIRYTGYPTLADPQTVVSSVFDTGQSSNTLRSLAWTAALTGGTSVQFQVQTASSASGVWSGWMGPGGTNGTYFTTSGSSVPYALHDAAADQFIQYKTWLIGTGQNTPTISVTSMTFGTFGVPVLNSLIPTTSTQITLNFTDNSGDEDDFRLSTDLASGPVNDVRGFNTADKIGSGVVQISTATGLSPDTLYYIRLRAHETPTLSYSGFSNELSTITLAAPASGYAVTPAATSLTVTFGANGNPGTTKYQAELATNAGFSTGYQASSGWQNYSFVSPTAFSGLVQGTTYYLRANSRNNNGLGTVTYGATVTAIPVADPTVAGSPVALSSTSISVSWGANSNPTYVPYRVEYSTASNFTGSADKTSWTVGTSSTAVGLSRTTTYYVQIQAADTSFDLAPTKVQLGSVMTLASPPTVGTRTLDLDNRIDIAWGANGNLAGSATYYLQRSTDATFATAVSTTLTTLTGNADYWSARASAPAGISLGGSLVHPGSGDYIYAFLGNATTAFRRYSISGNAWSTRAVAPAIVSSGGNLVYPGSGDYIYAFQGNSNTAFWRYSISGDMWDTMTSAPGIVSNGDSLVYPGSGDYIYAFQGNSTTAFWRYSISGNAWSTRAVAPAIVSNGGSLVYPGSGDYIYAFQGNSTVFWRYSILGNTWDTTRAVAPATISNGGSLLVYPGSGEYIYACQGGGSTAFWRYKLADSLAPLTTYYFQVYAANAAGAANLPATVLGSTWTAPSFPYPNDPPFVAGGTYLQVNATSGTWAGYNPAGTQYDYQIAATPVFGSILQDSAWRTDQTSWTFSGLAINTGYYVRVESREGSNPSNVSGWLNFPQAWTTVNQPSFFTVTVVSSVAVRGNWNANGNPGGTLYLLESATDSGFTQNYGNSDWTTAVSTTIIGLTPNTYYYFRASAKGSAGPSPYTSSLTAYTNASPPGSPSLSNVFGNSAQFNWTQNGNPSGTQFWAEIATGTSLVTPPGPWVALSTAGWLTVTQNNFTGLTAATTYWFRVKATDANSIDTAWTTAISTMTPVPPAAPSALYVDLSGASAAQTDRVYLRWNDDSSNEDGFTLQRSLDGSNWVGAGSLLSNTTFYPDTGLATATSYYYRVQACSNAAGCSAWSNTAEAATRAKPPMSPLFSGVGVTSVTVSWNANANPGNVAYQAEISTSPAFNPYPDPDNLGAQTLLGVASALESAIVKTAGGYRLYYSSSAAFTQLAYRDTMDANPPVNGNLGAAVLMGIGSASGQNRAPGVVKCGAAGCATANGYRLYYSTYSSAYWQLAYKDTTNTNPPDSGNLGAQVLMGVGSSYSDQGFVQVVTQTGGGYRFYYSWSNDGLSRQLAYRDTTNADLPGSGNLGPQILLGVGGDRNFPSGVIALPNGIYRFYYGHYNGGYWRMAYQDTLDSNPPNFSGASNNLGPRVLLGGSSVVESQFAPTPFTLPDGTTRLYYSWYNASWQLAYKDASGAPAGTGGWALSRSTSTSQVFSNLIPGTTYYFRVRALNGDGEATADVSPATNWAQTSPVAAPTLNALTAVSSTQISVAWTDTSPAEDDFQLYADVNSSPTLFYSSRTTVDKPGVGVADGYTLGASSTALIPDTRYYVRLRGHEALYGTFSPYSNQLSTYTLAAPPVSSAFGSVWPSSITASWGAGGNPGYVRYVAELSTSAAFSGVLSSATVNAAAQWTGLIPGASYYLRVRALNEYGAPTLNVSPASPVMTPPDLPGPPLVAYDNYSDHMTVKWDVGTSSPTMSYRVQRSLPNTPGFGVVGDDSLWQTGAGAFTFTFLQYNTTYYFRAAALNAAGVQSGWAVLPSSQTMAETPLSAASDVFITSITARWVMDAGIFYQVERSALGDYSAILSSSNWQAGVASYYFTGLTPNTNAFVRVRARNSSNVETPNTELYNQYTRADVPGDPVSPYTVAGNVVTVNWSQSGNPAGQTQYYAVSASTPDFSAGTSSSGWTTSNAFNFSGLATATTYYFRVKARNNNATPVETAWHVLPDTVTLPAPASPTGLVLSFPDASSTNKLQLDWSDNSTDEIGWRVYRGTDGVAFSLINTLGGNPGTGPMTYTDVALSSNTLYWYKVGAYNASPGEAFSGDVSTYTRAGKPDAGTFSGVQSKVTAVAWTAAGNPADTSYVCEVSSDGTGAFTFVSASSQTRNASALFSSLLPATTYFARVRALNGFGVPTSDLVIGSTVTLPLAVTFALTDAAPSAITQGNAAAFAKIVAAPNNTGVSWTQLSLTRTGSGADADAARVAVRRDGNGDGAYQSGNDPEVGWGTFSGGAAAISLTETLNAAATYFVVIKEADDYISWPGNTLGLTLESLVSPNSTVTKTPGTFSTSLSTMAKLADTLYVTGMSTVSTPNVSRGYNNVAFLKLTMSADRDRAYLRRIALQKLGTLADADVTAVKVYRDANLNGGLDIGGGDDLVSSGVDAFSGGLAVVELTNPSTQTVTNMVYFVTLDLAGNAPLGATVGVRAANAAALGLMSGTPDVVTLGVTPTDSAVPTVSDPPNILTITPTDIQAGAPVQQGQEAAMLRLDMNTNSGNSVMTSLKVQRLGTSVDSDYALVELYRDNPPLGVYGPTDTMVASGTFVGGQLIFPLNETVPQTSTKTYFLVTTIAPLANTSDQAGLLLQAGYVQAASAQTTISAPFPIQSSPSQILETINILDVTPDAPPLGSPAPGFAYQSATNVPLLALQMQTRANAVNVSGLTLQEAGTALDTDVSALRVYKDDGDGVFGAGSDQLITSNYGFSGGTATVSFSALQAVATSSSVFFVVGDVAATAVNSRTIQLRLSQSSAVGAMAPNVVSSTFPILSNLVTVEKLPASVYFSTTSLAPASAQAGTADIRMLRLAARTDQSTTQIQTLSLLRTGGADADVAGVSLWWDSDGSATLEPSERLSSGVFSAGALTLGLPGTAQGVSTSPKDLYLTMSFSASAAVGDTVGLTVSGAVIPSPDGLRAGAVPFSSSGTAVAKPPSQLLASFQSCISSEVYQGSSAVLVASAALGASAYYVDWTGLRVLRSGNGADGDASKLRLYRDNGDGVWGGSAQETQIATATFSGGAALFAFASERMVYPSTKTYYLTADIANTAVSSATFGVSVPAASYLSVASPDSVSPSGFSFTSALAVIKATVDTMVVDYSNLSPSVKQGDLTVALGRLTARANSNGVRWNSVKLDKGGGIRDSDITRVQIYKDEGDGLFGAGDVLAGRGSVSNGAVTVTFDSPQSLDAVVQSYFVTVDFSTNALIGSSVTFTAANADFGLDAPDVVAVTAGPVYFSMAGVITDAPDEVYLAATSLAPANVYQGSSGAAMARLNLWSVNDGATLTSLKVALVGSGSPTDLAAVGVYADADGNGVYDAGDLLLAKAAMVTSPMTLNLAVAQTITASTKTYFVVADISPAAMLGATLGVAFLDAGYFGVGTDSMTSSALPFTSAVTTVLDPQTPMQPTVSLPDGSYSKTFDSIRFVWTSTVPTGSLSAAYYAVGVTAGGAETVPWTGISGAPAEVRVSGLSLANGGTYYVSVKTISSWGKTSAVGMSGGQMIDYTALTKPAPPSATVGASAVLLSWAPAVVGPSGVKGYLIEYRRGESPVWYNARTKLVVMTRSLTLSSGGTAVAVVSDADLIVASPYAASGLPNGTLYFRLSTVNNAGVASAPSDSIRVQVGAAPPEGISGVSSYPNPFDSRQGGATIVYTLSADADAKIEFFSIFGVKVKGLSFAAGSEGGRLGVNAVSWDGGGDSGGKASKGIYIMRITSNGATATYKVGVIH